ncbi:hypothetical protein [Streptomyces sp. NPDC051014]|uniref:hypothetical protein n=1 Tax=Streptomyces sp. NPDC051014 TaxID=3155751 RepID=UPI0033D37EC7
MLVKVLLAHGQLPGEAMVTTLRTCLRLGSVSSDLVGIEARKAMEGTDAEDAELLDDTGTDTAVPPGQGADRAGAHAISLHTRRLSPDPRKALPDMSKCDRLLSPVVGRESQSQKSHRDEPDHHRHRPG